MDTLVLALGPVFAAGFAVQQFLEIMDPLVKKIGLPKRITHGFISLAVGFMLAIGAGLRVLAPLGVEKAGIFDVFITALIVSAGTEGINSVMKFLGYAKEGQAACAAVREAQPEARAAAKERARPIGKLSVR